MFNMEGMFIASRYSVWPPAVLVFTLLKAQSECPLGILQCSFCFKSLWYYNTVDRVMEGYSCHRSAPMQFLHTLVTLITVGTKTYFCFYSFFINCIHLHAKSIECKACQKNSNLDSFSMQQCQYTEKSLLRPDLFFQILLFLPSIHSFQSNINGVFVQHQQLPSFVYRT
jgi:hypothetical protein